PPEGQKEAAVEVRKKLWERCGNDKLRGAWVKSVAPGTGNTLVLTGSVDNEEQRAVLLKEAHDVLEADHNKLGEMFVGGVADAGSHNLPVYSVRRAELRTLIATHRALNDAPRVIVRLDDVYFPDDTHLRLRGVGYVSGDPTAKQKEVH